MTSVALDTTNKGHRWPKGVSGNPAGRPRSHVDAYIRQHLDLAEWYKRVLAIAMDPKDRDKVRALELLVNRGWGTPKQTIGLSRDEDDPGVLAMRQLYSALRGEPLTGVSGLADDAAVVDADSRVIPQHTEVDTTQLNRVDSPTVGSPRTPSARKPRRPRQEE